MGTTTILTSGGVIAYRPQPIALIVADPPFGVVGSVIVLNGQGSSDAQGSPLAYTWEFASVPIGSRVGVEGFRTLDTETDPAAPVTNSPSKVSFSPDLVGEYSIRLTVFNGVQSSDPFTIPVSIRSIMVPHGRGLVPDGKFIWTYIRDVWNQVENKEWFETLWSALIQLVGTEMLKLYQVDFNKSIRDIQDLYQRRWLSYEPRLALDESDLSFILGYHQAGISASSVPVGAIGEVAILDSKTLLVVAGKVRTDSIGKTLALTHSLSNSNLGSYVITGVNTAQSTYSLKTALSAPTADRAATNVSFTFTFQSPTWTPSVALSNFVPGSIIYYTSGLNKGFYRVVSVDTGPGTLTIDRTPPSFSDATTSLTYKASVYYPVGAGLPVQTSGTTDTFSIPIASSSLDLTTLAVGRLVTFAGRSYTIARIVKDINELVPCYLVSVQDTTIPLGLSSGTWRTPHTLISGSLDFEVLGVSPGDLLLFDVTSDTSNSSAEVVAQVVGVDGDRLGFVITDDSLTAGIVPAIPNKNFTSISENLNISAVKENPDGSLSFSGFAQSLLTESSSLSFQRAYWNTGLSSENDLNVLGYTFRLHPKAVVRNRSIPVDSDLRSVPVLQEYIKQLDQLPDPKPYVLIENSDYLVDNEVAFSGKVTITTGTSFFEAEGIDFIDRGLVAGDTIQITLPITVAGTYTIQQVISNSKVLLTTVIPLYFINGGVVTVTAKILRGRTGHFLRFAPGLFSAATPAPARLWGEVSFFDNNQAIEDNFGILIGLTKDDLQTVSDTANYRQAVTGMMYAMTQGSSLSTIRLGLQILLGLPFAEHRGIIRSIEPDYRKNDLGIIIAGRLLIEDIDTSDGPLGTFRVYVYPIDVESFDLSGIETNPATEVEYAVGDIVEQFSPLCKGVTVEDYLSHTPSAIDPASLLQKFHRIDVRANDSIFNINELDLLSSFLKKITPAYIAYAIISEAEFVDSPVTSEHVTIKYRPPSAIDNPATGVSTPLMFGALGRLGSRLIFGDTVYTTRRAGTDLLTTNGSSQLSSATGGFLNPLSGESFDAGAGLCKIGDVVHILEGDDAGFYPITTLNSNTVVTVSGAPSPTFNGTINNKFVVLRKLACFLVDSTKVGTPAVASGVSTLVLSSGGLIIDGVRPGDWLILGDNGGVTAQATRHYITSVVDGGGGSFNTVNFTPATTFSANSLRYIIFRPNLAGDLYSTLFNARSGGGNNLSFTSPSVPQDAIIQPFLDPLDQLYIFSTAGTAHTVIDPNTMYVTPAVANGGWGFRIKKRGFDTSAASWNTLTLRNPTDALSLSLKSVPSVSSLATTSSSKTLTISAGATTAAVLATLHPGDTITLNNLTTGGAGGDTGGPYGIVSLSGTTLITDHLMTTSLNYHFTITRSA